MKGEELTTEMLAMAYAQGIFPMTVDEEADEVGWFRSNPRCLFPIEGIHVSRSLAKTIRSGRFTLQFDHAFAEVVRACRRPEDNWITESFVRVYSEAHWEGWAHCAEVYADGELVGGVYGVAVGTLFSAESMFHRQTDASKVALWAMINRCRELGFTVFDAQIMNPHLASLGAFEVSDRKFDRMLAECLVGDTEWSRRTPRYGTS